MEHYTDNRCDVVVVGAHPDDVEIACGGTIAAMIRQGYRVAIVDLTNGEPTPLCPNPETRLREAMQAAKILGVEDRTILSFPNRRLMDGFEERIALAKEFRRLRPSIVIGFGNKTPMASPDHFQAMQITDAAVFYSRLSKWDEYFGGLAVHAIERQLYFRLAFEPASLAGFDSHFTMDISDTLDRKMEAIACYQTQFPPAKAHVLERVKAIAIAAGSAAGFRAGETFACAKPLGIRDLVNTLLVGGTVRERSDGA
jgi:LmbE family N-acetylglucosaminyl deacetylase